MADDNWVQDFLDTPYRDLKPKKQSKTTPHAKAKKDIIAELHKLPGHKRIEVRNVAFVEHEGRKMMFGRKGEGDLRLTWKPPAWPFPCPMTIAIEVKVGADKQSHIQQVWQVKWEETGAVYWICGTGKDAWNLCIKYWRQLIDVENG